MSVKLMVLFLLTSHLVQANDKYMAVLGAGAEDRSKPYTIFDDGMAYVSDYVRYARLKKVDVLFNGGHKVTEQKLQTQFSGKPISNFTNKNLNQLIAAYKEKIINGTIKPGDQILLSLDTHGAPRTNDITHKIATVPEKYDEKNTSLYDLFSMDQLKDLMATAKAKKVKLGILDLGCYSGNTLSLADGNACIISSSDKELFSFKGEGTFTSNFFKGMKPGKNLEQVFLEARKNTYGDRSMPMISTDEGNAVSKSISSLITPYFRFADDGNPNAPHTNFREYVNIFDTPKNFCQRDNEFKDLMANIDRIEKLEKNSETIFSTLFGNEADFTLLKNYLKEYKVQQDRMLKEYYTIKSKLKNKVIVDFVDANGKPAKQEYTVENLVSTDYKALLGREMSGKNPSKMLISLYRAIDLKKDEVLKSDPNVGKLMDGIKNLTKKVKTTVDYSVKIATKERALYDAAYRNQKKSPAKSNPCSDFVI